MLFVLYEGIEMFYDPLFDLDSNWNFDATELVFTDCVMNPQCNDTSNEDEFKEGLELSDFDYDKFSDEIL